MSIIAALRAIVVLIVAGITAITTVDVVPIPENRIPTYDSYKEIPDSKAPSEVGIQGVSTPRTDLKSVELPSSETVAAPEEVEIATSPQEPIQLPHLPPTVIATQTRGAVVHLLCHTERERSIRAVTGSGVTVDPRGIVLTNAHVAQFWLLPEINPLGKTDCRVRAAVPVDREYRAELLYLPASWIAAHAKDIDNPDPKGTGEHDYALLRIVEPVRADYVFPAVFPFVTYTTSDAGIAKGDDIFIAAYPAIDSEASVSELASLDIASTKATVEDVFTFSRSTLDLISLGSSALSFKGSSGGAVVSDNNELIGIITTSTSGETSADRELRAITISHIDRSLRAHIGLGLVGLLSGNLETKAATFNTDIAQTLREALISEL